MPDLNSVPASPHALAASRRQSSQQMPPPPVPTSPCLNILPSNQNAVNNISNSSLPSPHLPPPAGMPPGPVQPENAAAAAGPGPIRHPRPLTAAELHLELEKEQEAVVNRLTRELQLLRAAQNASVVSNASSTSASASGTEPALVPDSQHLLSGSGFSIPSSSGRRHHRTASNASARSITAATGSGLATNTTSVVGITAPAPIRPGATPLSRQNSSQSRRSQTGSPAPHAQSSLSSHPHSYTHSHMADPALAAGYFHHRSPPGVPGATPGSQGQGQSELSPGILPATTRYEETAFYRSELESVKRENDALKRRIRELERMVRDRRASDASRTRSESVSTTASVGASTAGGGGVAPGAGAGIAGPREGRERVVSMLSTAGSVGVGVPEDEVRVGESAASAGLRAQESGPSSAQQGA